MMIYTSQDWNRFAEGAEKAAAFSSETAAEYKAGTEFHQVWITSAARHTERASEYRAIARQEARRGN